MKNQNNSFEEQILNSQIVNNSWTFSSGKTKDVMLKELGDIVAKHYVGQINPEFNYQSFGFERRSSLYGGDMYYMPSKQMIHVDYSLLMDKKIDIIANIAHEATHHGQQLAVNQMQSHGQTSTLISLNSFYDSQMFNKDTFGNLYDVGVYRKDQYEPLRFGFYQLNVVEREARQMESKVCKLITGKESESMGYVDMAVKTMQNRYNCPNITRDELYKAIDNAYDSVYYGRIPNNPLEASIAYDIVAFRYGEKAVGSIDDKEFHKESLSMLDSKNKSIAMSQAGFENTLTMHGPSIKHMSLDKITALSQEEVTQNPHVIAYGIKKHGAENLMQSDAIRQQLEPHEIGSTSFDRWYFSDGNFLSQKILDAVAKELGQEYQRIEQEIPTYIPEYFVPSIPEIDLNEMFCDYIDRGQEQVIDHQLDNEIENTMEDIENIIDPTKDVEIIGNR